MLSFFLFRFESDGLFLEPYLLQIHLFGSLQYFVYLWIVLSCDSLLSRIYWPFSDEFSEFWSEGWGNISYILSFFSQPKEVHVIVSKALIDSELFFGVVAALFGDGYAFRDVAVIFWFGGGEGEAFFVISFH